MRPVCTFLAFAIVPAALAGEPQLRFLANLEGARPRVSANVAFSPDGKTLASSDYDDDGDVSAVKVWDVAKRKVAATFGGPTYRVSSVAFSPDGKTLAAAGRDSDGDTIRLWDVATGKEKAAIKASTGDDCPVSFSPDGKALAWGGAQAGKTGLVGGRADHLGVKLWDLTAGKEKASLQDHAGPIFTVAFSRDGKLLASGGGEFASNGQARAGEVKLWAVATGRERVTLSGRGTPPLRVVSSVAFSPDGEVLASADGFGNVLLWDVPSGKRRAVLQAFDQGKEEDANPAYSVAFSPDGKTLAAGTVRGIKLWDVKSGKEVGTVKGASGTVWSVAFSRDGKTVATAGSKRVTGPRDRFGDDPVLRVWEVIPSKEADE